MPLNMNFNEYSVDLALINNVRGEAIALHSTGSATGLGSLVLPGADLRETVSHYKLGAYSGAQQKPFGVDAAWSRAARVEVTQWTLKGSYPVHASSGAR